MRVDGAAAAAPVGPGAEGPELAPLHLSADVKVGIRKSNSDMAYKYDASDLARLCKNTFDNTTAEVCYTTLRPLLMLRFTCQLDIEKLMHCSAGQASLQRCIALVCLQGC